MGVCLHGRLRRTPHLPQRFWHLRCHRSRVFRTWHLLWQARRLHRSLPVQGLALPEVPRRHLRCNPLFFLKIVLLCFVYYFFFFFFFLKKKGFLKKKKKKKKK